MIKIIHEGGVLSSSEDERKFIENSFALKPVLYIENSDNGNFEFLMSSGGVSLDIQHSELLKNLSKNPPLLMKMLAAAYDSGAALYHCKRLATTYRTINESFEKIDTLPGMGIGANEKLASFSYQPEPYFEFDAVLSAARRSYDKIGSFVWSSFEPHEGGMPRNLSDMLRAFKNVPQPLVERLQESWNKHGQTLKDYRDCTQHFAAADLPMSTVTMVRLNEKAWKVWARIPDNPKVGSKRKFTYENGFDALSYSWVVCDEIIALAVDAADIVWKAASS